MSVSYYYYTIVVNDVKSRMALETPRVFSDIRRMGPTTRENREREMVPTCIPEDKIREMISTKSDSKYYIEYFNQRI